MSEDVTITFEGEELASPWLPAGDGAPAVLILPTVMGVSDLERERIIDALKQCGGNQTKAAEMLGISRRTLLNRLDQYNLPRPRK